MNAFLSVIICFLSQVCIGIDLGVGTYAEGADQFCYDVEDCSFDYSNVFASENSEDRERKHLRPDLVHVAIVACGDRQPETAVAVKAIVVTAVDKVYFHIFTEDELREKFQLEFDGWPSDIKSKFKYILHPIKFPPDRFYEWKKLFKTCAAQRLFIPAILRTVDSVLYIDTDILLMRPVQDLWAHFAQFNKTQIAAVAPEHESPNAGWYNRFARHPYYGFLGINSGVMLMNLTRIRQLKWLEHMDEYLVKYKYNITWGDQDLLNIFFHYYPEMLFIYDCSWNYRPDHCMYMSTCKAAEVHGVSVIHGNRGTLHNNKEPIFKVIYDAFKNYQFDGLANLLRTIELSFSQLKYEEGRCEAVQSLFINQLKNQVPKEQ